MVISSFISINLNCRFGLRPSRGTFGGQHCSATLGCDSYSLVDPANNNMLVQPVCLSVWPSRRKEYCVGELMQSMNNPSAITCLPVCLAFRPERILRWRIDKSDEISFGNDLSACLFGPQALRNIVLENGRVGRIIVQPCLLCLSVLPSSSKEDFVRELMYRATSCGNSMSACLFGLQALKNTALENSCLRRHILRQ